MLLLKRWPKEAFHKLCAERWDVNNDEHSFTQGDTEVRNWAFILHVLEIERDARNKKTQRLLSRPGPESSAQRSHGAKKPAEEGGAWIICAEGRRPDNTVKDH